MLEDESKRVLEEDMKMLEEKAKKMQEEEEIRYMIKMTCYLKKPSVFCVVVRMVDDIRYFLEDYKPDYEHIKNLKERALKMLKMDEETLEENIKCRLEEAKEMLEDRDKTILEEAKKMLLEKAKKILEKPIEMLEKENELEPE
jgi:hypothetical protein